MQEEKLDDASAQQLADFGFLRVGIGLWVSQAGIIHRVGSIADMAGLGSVATIDVEREDTIELGAVTKCEEKCLTSVAYA